MGTSKKILSVLLVFIFTTFVSLYGVPAGAAPKKQVSSTVINKQIVSATSYVVNAEKFVGTSAFDVKKAQALVSAGQVQVNKISTYGTKYKKTYDSLTKRLNNAKVKINNRIKMLAAAAAVAAQTAKANAAAQTAKANAVKAANAVVSSVEATANVTYDKLVSDKSIIPNLQNAISAAKLIVAKLDTNSVDYLNLSARLIAANTKVQNAIDKKAKADAEAIKSRNAVEVVILKAELTFKSSEARLATSDTVFKNAQNTFLAAQTALAKYDSKSSDYKGFLARVNAIKVKIQKVIDDKSAAAQEMLNETTAEGNVKAVESAPLSTLADVTTVINLGNIARTAITKVTDTIKAASLTARLNAATARAAAFKTNLEAAAKLVSVSAVDGGITVVFDKTPISGVNAADFKILKSINGGAQTAVTLSSVSTINATTFKLVVPTTAPLSNLDQSIIYSIQYTSNVSLNASAYVVPKIPYLTVTSITALNLKQVKVVFNKAVNKISAETISNYLEDTTPLSSWYAKAELQSDNTSVIITYANAKIQQSAISMTARSVSNDSLTETMTTATFSVNFTDLTIPTVTSITNSGNTSITINFSEPVNGANSISSYLIDGNNPSIYGAASVIYSDTVTPSKQTAVTITFGSGLSNGTHTFSILGSYITDAAGLYLTATSQPINFTTDLSKPSITNVTATGLSTIDITFNKPVALPSIYNIYVNGVQLNSLATMYYKDSTTKTVIEITKAGLLVNGTNLIYMGKSTVADLYGYTNDTSELSYSVSTTGNNSVTTVVSANAVNDKTISITFSNPMSASATVSGYYTIRNSAGNIAATIISVTGQGASYYINLATSLLAGVTYTLTVSGVTDAYGYTVYPSVNSISVGSSASQLPPTAELIDQVGKLVRITFSEPMDNSSITTKTNYQISLLGYGTYAPLDYYTTITSASDLRSIVIDFPDSTAITSGVSTLMINPLRNISGIYDSGTSSYTIAIGSSLTSAKASLLAQISAATTELGNAVEGTALNQYPAPAKANFQAVVNAATSIYNTAVTLSDLTAAQAALASADSTFNAAKVTTQGTGVTRGTIQSVPGIASSAGVYAVATLSINSGVAGAVAEVDTLDIPNGINCAADTSVAVTLITQPALPFTVSLSANDDSQIIAAKIAFAIRTNCSGYSAVANGLRITITCPAGLIYSGNLITVDCTNIGKGSISSSIGTPGQYNSGNIVLRLDGTDYTIPVSPTESTAAAVAMKIRATLSNNPSYGMGGTGNVVLITKNNPSPMTYSFNGGTLVTGQITNNTTGAAASSGSPQVNTVPIAAGASYSGTLSIRVTDGSIDKIVSVPVVAGDNAGSVAQKICTQMQADTTITNANAYTVSLLNANVIFTRNVPAAPQTFGFTIQ
jgi:hypothetical protein